MARIRIERNIPPGSLAHTRAAPSPLIATTQGVNVPKCTRKLPAAPRDPQEHRPADRFGFGGTEDGGGDVVVPRG